MRSLRPSVLALALLAAASASAQEPFAELEQRPLVPGARFEAGERWLTSRPSSVCVL